jgi:inner membrane protein
VLLTHIGLDCLTSYGTQIFWPFSRTPVVVGTVFIIDPLYSVPLVIGLLASLWWPAAAQTRRWINYTGLAISSAYLLFTVVNKLHVEHVFETALQSQNRPAERVFTKPTAFNNLLWMAISEGEDGFHIGYYSLLDDDRQVSFNYVPQKKHLLGDAYDNAFVERLRWFSKGYYIVRRAPDGHLTIQDLRFGRNDLGLTSSGEYIFTFRLLQNETGTITGFRQERPKMKVSGPLLTRFVNRIRGYDIPKAPLTEDATSM